MAGITTGNTPQELEAIAALGVYQQQIASIRADPSLSDVGRQQQLAAAYIRTRDAVARLQSRATANASTRRDVLIRTLFGLTTTADPNAAISFRDAQDRAAALENPRAAQRLLDQANRTGDEHLAKAIAHRAYEDAWFDVLDKYASTRPSVEAKLGELVTQEPTLASTIGAAMAYAVTKPTELARFGEAAIANLANTAPGQ